MLLLILQPSFTHMFAVLCGFNFVLGKDGKKKLRKELLRPYKSEEEKAFVQKMGHKKFKAATMKASS